jgi:hypothetical protein
MDGIALKHHRMGESRTPWILLTTWLRLTNLDYTWVIFHSTRATLTHASLTNLILVEKWNILQLFCNISKFPLHCFFIKNSEEKCLFKNINFSENNIISVKAAKVLWYARLMWCVKFKIHSMKFLLKFLGNLGQGLLTPRKALIMTEISWR